jgi:hypothetical protein
MIAAISVPVIQTQMAEARITAAGDLVRGKMAEARARAMDEGRPWRFGFVTGAGVYQLAPDDSNEWNNVATDPDRRSDLIRDTLPPDIIFGLTKDEIMGSDGSGAGGGGNWSTAAVFLPDGSAEDDTIVYFGKGGVAPLRAKVRALTGIVNLEQWRPEN